MAVSERIDPDDHRVVCEVCEQPTVEPIYHADEGDAYCGSCVVALIGAERDTYKTALEQIAQRRTVNGHPLDDATRIAQEALHAIDAP